jgi:TonB family protein
MNALSPLPDVYSADEIARAAGVRPADVRALAERGQIRPLRGGRLFSTPDAIIAARLLAHGRRTSEHTLFRPAPGVRRKAGMPLAAAGTFHAAILALIAFVTSMGVANTQARVRPDDLNAMHLVFRMTPGPGGGGGGGGMKQPAPPPPAARKGVEKLHSPLPPVRKQPKPVEVVAQQITPPPPPPRIEPPPVVKPVDPPPVEKAQAVQPVFAPVVPTAADPVDRAGAPWKTPAPAAADSRGPGAGGGAGSGQGTGLGPGDGSGIGPGSGGGTGGGPYRPGAGITPPSILREVTPDYTDEGRRRAIQGDVVLEIVVRADGGVGSVKVLQGLGAGLDQRAIEAVRQWRFNPARRYGTPVDVIVEVAVEFKLR